jgi:hypothetical protein
VRRYLCGTQGYYPRIPAGYLDVEGVSQLERFAELARREGRPELMELFPYELVSEHVVPDWSTPAATFMRNWVLHARRLSGKAIDGRPAAQQAGEAIAVQ